MPWNFRRRTENAILRVRARFLQRQHIREIDQRIVIEVEHALTSKLRSLPEDDDITHRYGRFIKLANVNWDRPNYAWQLVVRARLVRDRPLREGTSANRAGGRQGRNTRYSTAGDASVRRMASRTPGTCRRTGPHRWRAVVVNEQNKERLSKGGGQGIQIFSTIEESREQCTGAGSFFRFSKPEHA